MTLICPFCFTLFMGGSLCCEGDPCPACEVGILTDYYNYLTEAIWRDANESEAPHESDI